MIDALATQPHYVDHLLPVWRALPEEVRGRFVVMPPARAHAQSLGLDFQVRFDYGQWPLTLVAAEVDYRTTVRLKRRSAFINHGVGQAWRDATGRLLPEGCAQPRPKVSLFLTPGPHATQTTREGQGEDARVVEIGSAKVEELCQLPPPREQLLVFSTHWDHKVMPESRGVLREYLPAVQKLAKRYPVALHAHPRVSSEWRLLAQDSGLEFIETFQEVCRRATLYAIDFSSTLYEFAALDRPVLVLNGANYRRDHRHGLRFWDNADVGVNVDRPEELEERVRLALEDAPGQQEARRRGVDAAYHARDGHAAQRAAGALLGWLKERGKL